MPTSHYVISVGAACFGVVAGYITHRTLLRNQQGAQISDLAAVLAAIGGGAVTALFPAGGDGFGWYAIGLFAGMAVYFVNFRAHHDRRETAEVLGTGARPRSLD